MKAFAYRVAEAATAGRGLAREVNGERIRFPVAQARFYPRSYQPEAAAFIRAHTRPGTTAIDVGAHIGVFTIPLARSVGPEGRVIAFEPTDVTRGVLLRTISLNELSARVEVRSEAASDAEGDAAFLVGAGIENANRLSESTDGRTMSVRTLPIDRLIPASELVSLIKIDAEGAELAVLRGAAETIARCRPALTIDVHAGTDGLGSAGLAALWTELTTATHLAPYRHTLPGEQAFLGATEIFELELVPD